MGAAFRENYYDCLTCRGSDDRCKSVGGITSEKRVSREGGKAERKAKEVSQRPQRLRKESKGLFEHKDTEWSSAFPPWAGQRLPLNRIAPS